MQCAQQLADDWLPEPKFVLAPEMDLVLRLVLIVQSLLSCAEKVNEIQIENSCENRSKTATVHSPTPPLSFCSIQ